VSAYQNACSNVNGLVESRPTSSRVIGDPNEVFRPGRWRYLRTAKVLLQLPSYARLVWGLARDARTPVALKAILIAALAYVIAPIDLIPDVIPILGAADDLTVLLLVLDLFINNAPAEVREEHMARAKAGQAVLDEDLARLRTLLGARYDRIRDTLPELLHRFGGLRDADEVKKQIAGWRAARGKTVARGKTAANAKTPVEAK
jgi:uncharacterized membrane protein YkvA (DUF1232 family)